MLTLLGRAGAFLEWTRPAGQVLLGALVLVSPFSPRFAGRLSKKPASVVYWFALVDAIALLWSAAYLVGFYSLAGLGARFPVSAWFMAWAASSASLVFFIWTLIVAVRAHRTSAST